MPPRKKRKKGRGSESQQTMLIFACVFLAITVVVAVSALLLRSKKETQPGEPPGQEENQLGNTQNNSDDPLPPGEDEANSTEKDEDEENQPQEGEAPSQEPISFNKPATMKGVFVIPKEDFFTDPAQTEENQKQEIEAMVKQAQSLGMNTLFVDLVTGEGTAFQLETIRSISTFDAAAYLLETARENNLFIYGIYDLSYYPAGERVRQAQVKNTQQANLANGVLEDMVKKYQFDGILLAGCENPDGEAAFADYMLYGGGRTYQQYMEDNAAMLVTAAKEVVSKYAQNTQVGLLTDGVWAAASQQEGGLEVTAGFTALETDRLNSKALAEQQAVDFVAVRNYGSTTDPAAPFTTVAKWWDQQAQETGLPVYMVHGANRACTTENPGWSAHDQLTRQVISLEECSNLQGSIFNSLASLSANPKNSTTLLQDYYSNNVKAEHILKELTFTRPTQLQISTTDKTYTFQGASDPNSPVTMDGKTVETDENGFFSVTVSLSPGENKYTFNHKEKTMTFTINRQVQVIQEVTPVGSLSVDGGMKVTITAVAYENSSVYAAINGQNIPMSVDETADNEDLRGTSYIRYTGIFTAPKGQAKAQQLGNITITATWEGITKTMEGASVTVNKLAVVEDGVLVRVTADQAITFPTNEIGKYPEPNCFRLPKGTLDYAVGDEVVYKDEEGVRKYYKLASGLRVYSDDIAAVSDGTVVAGNIISGLTVKADKQFTYVILTSEYPVPFKPKYSSTRFEIDFQYTTSTPEDLSLSKNPLFSSAAWDGTTLSLGFINQNGFLGYTAYHDNGAIVFRFNNPTTISGARIVVDPGHGGGDNGAPGFNPNYQEKHINWAMAKSLAEALENKGANVLLLKTLNQTTSMDARLQQARSFNAVVYISVHHNSAQSAATGTEAYYFYPFAQSLASRISTATSQGLNTNNRGAKYGVFYVTRDPQFVGVLSEGGFLTNNKEYNKLINDDYQKEVGENMASAIATFLKNAGSGSAGITGTQSTGDAVTDVKDPENSGSNNPGTDEKDETEEPTITEIRLKDEEVTLAVGETTDLQVKLTPSDADEDALTWESSNTKIVRVNGSGKIRGESPGTATITVSAGDVTAKCTVTVTAPEDGKGEEAEELEDISIKNAPQTMKVGDRVQLEVEVSPAGAKIPELEWEVSSSSEKLARINGNGLLEALAPGSVSVRVRTADGQYASICKIEITE